MSEENKSPVPAKEWLEERAEKYIEENNEWMFDQNHFHITRSFVNTILRQAYIAGDQSSLQPSSPDHTVDEIELWREVVKVVEDGQFLSTKYKEVVDNLKLKYRITRK